MTRGKQLSFAGEGVHFRAASIHSLLDGIVAWGTDATLLALGGMVVGKERLDFTR